MSYLYITDNNAHVGISKNQVVVKTQEASDESKASEDRVPIETLEAISVFGRAQITTQCIQECMKRNISLVYYSSTGVYLGRLQPSNHIGVKRQRLQAAFNHTDIALSLAGQVISAKIHNQMTVMSRYGKSKGIDIKRSLLDMKILSLKASVGTSISQIMGFEGSAARIYFDTLSRIVDPEFHFESRNRRPPRDPFNAMLSLGYSMLLNEVYVKIYAKGLNPYFGFIHEDREKHPTLASDLMEEWRAVIVDTVVLSLINGHEIRRHHFEYNDDYEGVYLTSEGRKIFMAKMEKKMRQENKYLKDVEKPVSFRRAIECQVNSFANVLEDNEIERYSPVWIR